MTPELAARAADLLRAARADRRPCVSLPEDCRPRDLADGYAIQDAVVARAGSPVAGFKIGATSEKAQSFLGIDSPFSGRIFKSGVQESPARLSAGDFIFRLIEPEFAFRLTKSLPACPRPYSESEVADAAGTLHPAFEVVQSAYGSTWSTAGAPALVADNGVHGAFVLGPATSRWREFDLTSHAVTLSRNGEPISSGVGGNALGGPLIALTWLVNQQRGFGRDLQPSMVVTTGVVTDFVLVEAGDQLVADFGPLGRVELSFDP